MDINLDWYRVFDAVARAGSFSGAARSLYISQPAVSLAVQQLEQALGTKLFLRSQRGVTLTHEGEVLRGYVGSAVALIGAGERKVQKLKELSAGELRIGAGDTACKWFLLPCIEKFHAMYQEVSLSVTNRTSSETIKLLRSGQLDIGFVNMPISAEGVIFEPCLPLQDIFIAGSPFSYLRNRTVTLHELSTQPLIMLERISNSRRWVDRHFFENGAAVDAEIELGSHDLLHDYARMGMGVACVIREFTEPLEPMGLFSITLDHPIPPRSLGVCYLDGIPLSEATKRFIALTKSHTEFVPSNPGRH